ncbi:MAG: peptidylprolyl isomerase [Bacteroidota bacterium]|jgi:peptidyl-prolyl cis-trans isomerase SurA
MRSNRVTILGLFLVAAACIGPMAQAQQKNSVVAEIGDYKLTLGEYERQYIRNNGGETAAYRSGLDTRQEFLDLLVKYRLKVIEARAKGYDKDPEILRELGEYRNSLAIPYLTERALIDPKIEELYKQRLEEMRAAHILIRIPTDSLGVADTLSAYNKALDVIRQANSGVRFDSLARQYSDDKGTAETGGDLMWFSAGMTVPVFDQAVYALKPGQIRTLPVRTMFGYHVVKLLDRKPARGEIQVSHILVRLPQENPADTAAAYAKISSILDSLKKGEDFASLARRNSDDPGSGANGGDLGWVSRRKFVPEFEVVAFELKTDQISRIVRTQFGYHIIKATGERSPKSFEESRQELKDLYRRYSYEQDNGLFLERIIAKYKVKTNQDVTDLIIASVDTTATTSAPGWYNRLTEALKEKVWISMQGANVTVGEAIKTIERNQDLQSKALNRESLASVATLLGQKEALRLETADLETRYPEFGALMQEYREGVLLFRAEQDAVWNSVKVEEDKLKEFWEQHKSEYTWPDRVRFSEIFVTSDSLGTALRDSLNAGVDFGELAERHTQRTGYKKKQGDWGFQAQDANELAVAAAKGIPGWIEGPMKYQYGFSIVKITEKEKAREKTFEEAQSEVSSKFQEFESKRLEREWIQSLKDKYGVKIHEDVLKKAFTDLKETK